MKRLSLLASMFTIVSFAATAQDLTKNDPGYHVNNYKHPNKAAHAAKKQTNTVAISEGVVMNKNYKQVGTKTVEKSLEIIRTEPKEVYLSRQNYKMPYNILKKEEKVISIKSDSVNSQDNSID
jgi:hypothetical protein